MFSKHHGVFLLLFLFLTISGTLLAAPGDLDTKFNSTGKVTTSNMLRVHAVAIQSDGKIVVVGEDWNGTRFIFGAGRYNTDGSLDTTFNSAGAVPGFVSTAISGSTEDKAYAVAIQSDGKIVAAGSTLLAATGYDFAIVRYNANGTLDTTFDSDGIKTAAIVPEGSADDIAYAIAIDSNGKIVFAGYTNDTTERFAVGRLNSNGSVDTDFGTSGFTKTDTSTGADQALAMAIQSDGKIVLAGFNNDATTGDDFTLTRYTTTGALDTTTFGTNGITKTAVASGTGADRIQGMAIDSSGRFVVVGYANSATSGDDIAVARYTSVGALDATFGTSGITTTAVASGTGADRANAVAIDSSGNILTAGYSSNGTYNKFALNRYTSAGALDTTFNSTGKVTTAIGSLHDIARGIALQSNGKIVVAGEKEVVAGGGDVNWAAARYDAQTYSLSIDNVTVTEGDSGSANATFTVTLSGAAGQSVTVDYATANDTAASSADYTSTSGTLTFAAGDTSKTISVPVLGETADEDNETFTVTLSNASNATISTATGTGTITDNDSPPTVSWSKASQSSTAEGSTLTVTAQLSAASSKTVTVPFTISGTATGSGTDYSITASPLTISAGATTASATITIASDTSAEEDETVILTIGTPTNASKGTTTVHTATITDDDAPTISIDDASTTEGLPTVKFTATLSQSSARTITVDYATADGTAKAASDYTAASGTLTFTAGETSQTVSVKIPDDSLSEDDEKFTLKLSNAANATIKTAEGTGTIKDNDPLPEVSLSISVSTLAKTASESAALTTGDVTTITATLSAKAGRDVTVKLSFSGTATLDKDFVVSASEITIKAGELTGTATVSAIRTNGDDGEKSLEIGVASLTNAKVKTAEAGATGDAATPTKVTATIVETKIPQITLETGAWGCSLAP